MEKKIVEVRFTPAGKLYEYEVDLFALEAVESKFASEHEDTDVRALLRKNALRENDLVTLAKFEFLVSGIIWDEQVYGKPKVGSMYLLYYSKSRANPRWKIPQSKEFAERMLKAYMDKYGKPGKETKN